MAFPYAENLRKGTRSSTGVTLILLLLMLCLQDADGRDGLLFAMACRVDGQGNQNNMTISPALASGEPKCACQDTKPDLAVPQGARVVLVCGIANHFVRVQTVANQECTFEKIRRGYGKKTTEGRIIRSSSEVEGLTCLDEGKSLPACILELDPVRIDDHRGHWRCKLRIPHQYFEPLKMFVSPDSPYPPEGDFELRMTSGRQCRPSLNNTDCRLDEYCHSEQLVCRYVCKGADGSEACSTIGKSSCKPDNKHGRECVCYDGHAGIYDKSGALERCRKKCSVTGDCGPLSGQECRMPDHCPPEGNCEKACIYRCDNFYHCPANECPMDHGICLKNAFCAAQDDQLEGDPVSVIRSANAAGCKCHQGFLMIGGLERLSNSGTPREGFNDSIECVKKCKTYLDCPEPDEETCTYQGLFVGGDCKKTCSEHPCDGNTALCIPIGGGNRECQCISEHTHQSSNTTCHLPVPPTPWHPSIFVGGSSVACEWPAVMPATHLESKHRFEIFLASCLMPNAVQAGVEISVLAFLNRTFPAPHASLFYPSGSKDHVEMSAHGGSEESYVKDYLANFITSFKPEDHNATLTLEVYHEVPEQNTSNIIAVFIRLNIFGCGHDGHCSSTQVCRESRTDQKWKCMAPCSDEMKIKPCPLSTSCHIRDDSPREEKKCVGPDGSVHIFTTPPTAPVQAPSPPKMILRSKPQENITIGGPLELLCHMENTDGRQPMMSPESSECSWTLHRNHGASLAAAIGFYGSNLLVKDSFTYFADASSLLPRVERQMQTQQTGFTCNVKFAEVQKWMEGKWSCHKSAQFHQSVLGSGLDEEFIEIEVQDHTTSLLRSPPSKDSLTIVISAAVAAGLLMALIAVATTIAIMRWRKRGINQNRIIQRATGSTASISTHAEERHRMEDWSAQFPYRRITSMQFNYDFTDGTHGSAYCAEQEEHIYSEIIPRPRAASVIEVLEVDQEANKVERRLSYSSPSVLFPL